MPTENKATVKEYLQPFYEQLRAHLKEDLQKIIDDPNDKRKHQATMLLNFVNTPNTENWRAIQNLNLSRDNVYLNRVKKLYPDNIAISTEKTRVIVDKSKDLWEIECAKRESFQSTPPLSDDDSDFEERPTYFTENDSDEDIETIKNMENWKIQIEKLSEMYTANPDTAQGKYLLHLIQHYNEAAEAVSAPHHPAFDDMASSLEADASSGREPITPDNAQKKCHDSQYFKKEINHMKDGVGAEKPSLLERASQFWKSK